MIKLYLLVILFCLIRGLTHEILYSRLGSFWAKWNEHIIWVIDALLFGSAIGCGVWYGYKNYHLPTQILIGKLVCLGIGSYLSYSFFHNGAYGVSRAYRLKLPILKAWTYSSKSDSAKYPLEFESRLLWFIMGLIFIAVGEWVIGI